MAILGVECPDVASGAERELARVGVVRRELLGGSLDDTGVYCAAGV